jgi:hypothetical protein
MESELIVLPGVCEKTLLAGGHVIESNYAMACGKQPVDHVAADKSSRTCDENPQLTSDFKRI